MKLFDKDWWKQQLHKEHIVELNELEVSKPIINLNNLLNLDRLKIGDKVKWTQASYFSGNVNGQGHMVPEVEKKGIIKNIILRKNNIKDYLIEISTYEKDGNDDYETINNNNFQAFLNSDWDNFSEFGELDELEINNPNKPKVGEMYDVKVWWVGDNWEINDYLQKIYEPADGTVGGAEGWYWSKGWKCVSIPNTNDIAFEDLDSGERYLYDPNEKMRKSTLNELEINDPNKSFLEKLFEHPKFDDHCVWAGLYKDGLSDDKGGIITKDSPNCIWNDTVKKYQTPQEAFKWLNTLNELEVNNPNVTKEKIFQYYTDNVIKNDSQFHRRGSESWESRVEFEDKYIDKYDLGNFYNWLKGTIRPQIILNKTELNQLYNDMRQLVQKYSNINELEISKPKKYIPIVKPTKPEYINSIENFVKLSHYIENTNLKLQKEIGRLNDLHVSEKGSVIFPLTIDKASKMVFLRWFFENLPNFYESRHIDIVNKWWNESRICLEDLEKKDINELEINEPLKFHIKIPEQWNEKTINTIDELEQLFKDFAKINPKLFKYIDLEYIIELNKHNNSGWGTAIVELWSGLTEGIWWYYYQLSYKNDFDIEWIPFSNLITKQFDKRLIDFNEIESTFNIKKLNELGINKPFRQWDFTKYIPNFNPNDIKIGDKIKIRTINLYTFTPTGKVIIFDVDRIEKYELEDGGLFFTNNEIGYDASGLTDINNNNKKKNLKESKQQSIKDSFKEFIKFLQQELPIKEKYNIKLTKDKSKTTSFAHFDPNNNEITVYIKGRNLMDSWRSLAHEWKHLHQNINKELTDTSGNDGSPHENEANAFAGLVMRKWGKLHPEYYTQLVENKINELEINNPNVTAHEINKDYINESQRENEIFSAYHGRYKFDVSKAYDLINQGEIKTKIKTYPPRIMHFLSHPEFSEANPEKYNKININYNEPLGLIANLKDEDGENELILIDGNHRTRKAVGEEREGKYIVIYDPNDVNKIITINNEIPKKLFPDDE